MNMQKTLGQLRASLTALGSFLLAWGLLTESQWAPVTGIALAAVSLLWGVLIHRDPAKPGKIKWSLFRKLLNAVGAGLIAWKLSDPERVNTAIAVVGSLGPFAASFFSWIDNDDGTDFSGPSILPALLLFASMFLVGCGIQVTPDGCLLGKYSRGGSDYYAGPCMGIDTDGDGDADVDRFRVKWTNDDGDRIRATYTLVSSAVEIEYLSPGSGGIWIGWSSKSGIILGPVPPEIEKALAGEAEPVPPPSPLPTAPAVSEP